MSCALSRKLIQIIGLLCVSSMSAQAMQVETTNKTSTNSALLEQQKAIHAAQQRQTGRILKMDKLPSAFRFKILTPHGRIKEITIPRQTVSSPTQTPLTATYNQGTDLDGPILYTPHTPKLDSNTTQMPSTKHKITIKKNTKDTQKKEPRQ